MTINVWKADLDFLRAKQMAAAKAAEAASKFQPTTKASDDTGSSLQPAGAGTASSTPPVVRIAPCEDSPGDEEEVPATNARAKGSSIMDRCKSAPSSCSRQSGPSVGTDNASLPPEQQQQQQQQQQQESPTPQPEEQQQQRSSAHMPETDGDSTLGGESSLSLETLPEFALPSEPPRSTSLRQGPMHRALARRFRSAFQRTRGDPAEVQPVDARPVTSSIEGRALATTWLLLKEDLPASWTQSESGSTWRPMWADFRVPGLICYGSANPEDDSSVELRYAVLAGAQVGPVVDLSPEDGSASSVEIKDVRIQKHLWRPRGSLWLRGRTSQETQQLQEVLQRSVEQIGCGFLRLRRTTSIWVTRWVFLQKEGPDRASMSWYRTPGEWLRGEPAKGSLDLIGEVLLRTWTQGAGHRFEVQSAGSFRTFELAAPTDWKPWVQAIARCPDITIRWLGQQPQLSVPPIAVAVVTASPQLDALPKLPATPRTCSTSSEPPSPSAAMSESPATIRADCETEADSVSNLSLQTSSREVSEPVACPSQAESSSPTEAAVDSCKQSKLPVQLPPSSIEPVELSPEEERYLRLAQSVDDAIRRMSSELSTSTACGQELLAFFGQSVDGAGDGKLSEELSSLLLALSSFSDMLRAASLDVLRHQRGTNGGGSKTPRLPPKTPRGRQNTSLF